MAKSYFFANVITIGILWTGFFVAKLIGLPSLEWMQTTLVSVILFTAAVAGSLWIYRAMLGRHQRPRAVAKNFGLSTPVGIILGFPMGELISGSFIRLWELLFGNSDSLLAFSVAVGGQLVTMFCISMMFGAIAKLFDGFKSVAPKKRH